MEEKKVVTDTYRSALIEREKMFPTGLDMEFLGKDLPNVAIPHTDTIHNLTENVVVVRLAKPVTFHNMIAPDKEVYHYSSLSSIIQVRVKQIFLLN